VLYKNEDAFAKAFKAGADHRAFFLYGSENLLIERWEKRVAAEENSFHYHRYNGKRLDLGALHEAMEAAVMGGVKCAVIDDLDWKALGANDQKDFAVILGDLAEDCLLVATARAPGFDARSAAGKKLIALFDKAGCAVELGARPPAGQVTFLKEQAKKGGCTISTDLCRHILRTCPSDMLSLSGEMRKLCAYAGGGELTREQVDAVCTPRTEARVFELQSAILAGNVARAMEILDALFYLRESAVMVLAVLGRAYVDLYRARVARDEGRGVQEVTAAFGYKGREFVVRNAFSGCEGLSAGYLRRALALLQDADARLKSSPADDRVLLEQAVVSLFALAGRRV